MMKCRVTALLFLLTFPLMGVGCRKATTDILIGEYISLTGSTASFGQSSHEGIRLATDEVNAAGGVLGRKITVITEDDQSKPEEAKIAVVKLIKRHKVAAILGEVASSRSLAAGPECQRHKVPMLTPASTNPKVTAIGDYIFRSCFIDPVQGGAMARFAHTQLQLPRVAILKDAKNDYSVGLADFFRRTFIELGGTITAEVAYAEGDVEFRAQLVAIKETHPAAMYIPGYYTEVGLIARQARELGITVPLLGGDGWDSQKTMEIGGAAVEGSYFTNHYAPDDPNPAVQNFVTKYQARFGRPPDAIAVLGYDAAHLLYDAIRRAGAVEPRKIREALAATKDFHGVAGRITIDPQRNAQKRIVVVQIAQGKIVFHSVVNLPTQGASYGTQPFDHRHPAQLPDPLLSARRE